MAKRVAIVGAGCTGLGAIKCCIDENMAPTCFESASDIGGLWRFTDAVTDQRGSVMSSTIINTSKEMMAFSDFPPPKEFPNFMHHGKVMEYFRLYADKFKLLQHIQFNTEVISIKEYRDTQLEKVRGNDACVLAKIPATTKSTSRLSSKERYSRTDKDRNNYSRKETGIVSCNDSQAQTDGGNENKSITNLLTNTKSSLTDHQWEIKVRSKITDEVSIHHFDCVLICTGHHGDINLPYFPGQSIFKGRIIHSRDLRRANEIPGSRHVVVGIGNSGCDAAVELSRHGQVHLSTHRGTWLMRRLQKHGLPADVVYMNRLVFGTALRLPTWILNKIAECHLNQTLDHSLYGLRPKHGPFATHPTVNDELPNRIASGHITIKPNIDSFLETGVRFEDGTVADDIDIVIMATGYKIAFPFLDQSTLKVKDNHCPLYLHMFLPTVASPTLAVIGCVQAGGAVVPVSEMQCRLAARVFKNHVQLPSQREMLKDIENKTSALKKRYIHTQRHTIQVDFLPYMDELAAMVGCKPKLRSLFIKDPHLALICITGPCTAYQYRLMGPGVWSGARKAIMTQMDRVRFPFSTRTAEDKSSCALLRNLKMPNALFVFLFLFAAVTVANYF